MNPQTLRYSVVAAAGRIAEKLDARETPASPAVVAQDLLTAYYRDVIFGAFGYGKEGQSRLKEIIDGGYNPTDMAKMAIEDCAENPEHADNIVFCIQQGADFYTTLTFANAHIETCEQELAHARQDRTFPALALRPMQVTVKNAQKVAVNLEQWGIEHGYLNEPTPDEAAPR